MTLLIPRAVLFGDHERGHPRLSPDGTRLAWTAPVKGVLNVWLAPIMSATGVDWGAAKVVTDDSDRGIRQFTWAHDGHHLLYLQDAVGDENWQLHDVDLRTMQRRDLTPFDGVQARLIASDRGFPNEMLISLNKDNQRARDVYRLDLTSGKLTKEFTNPGLISFAADTNLVVRAGLRPQPDASMVLVVRDTGESERWRDLLAISAEDSLTTGIVSFSADGQSLLVVSSMDAEAVRLLRIDLRTGRIEVLAEDPEADICGVRVHRATREPQIATLLKARSEYRVLDTSIADQLDAVRALHPGDPVFTHADDSDRVWLIAFTNDAGPVSYYAYDSAAMSGSFLFDHQPELSKYQLARMQTFSYQSRDGLTVHGYLTFPPAQDASGSAVLLVHGGPWARDRWGFDPLAQWLANRGYLCVQVNFRGSTGYGKAFLNSGDREWGGKMQDDLSDAIAHVISHGWADPAKIAIMGASYGGYAALAGAAFTPDLYRCAVDVVGPSNLITLIETIPPYWAPMLAQFHRRVGDPAKDKDILWARSPLSAADQIRIPLLIAQGANDPRVKQAESQQIVTALRRAGIECEYMLFDDEGHGFAKPANRLKFFAAAEEFLGRYLGGRVEGQ
jgi:dipeptidyl aminopeptidase/acylaminoacyl peptidase